MLFLVCALQETGSTTLRVFFLHFFFSGRCWNIRLAFTSVVDGSAHFFKKFYQKWFCEKSNLSTGFRFPYVRVMVLWEKWRLWIGINNYFRTDHVDNMPVWAIVLVSRTSLTEVLVDPCGNIILINQAWLPFSLLFPELLFDKLFLVHVY